MQNLTIIGNIAADSSQARKELFKFDIYIIIQDLLQNSNLICIPEFDDKLIWILGNLTQDMDQC